MSVGGWKGIKLITKQHLTNNLGVKKKYKHFIKKQHFLKEIVGGLTAMVPLPG